MGHSVEEYEEWDLEDEHFGVEDDSRQRSIEEVVDHWLKIDARATTDTVSPEPEKAAPRPDRHWLDNMPKKDVERAREVIETHLKVSDVTKNRIALECQNLVEKLGSEEDERKTAADILRKIGPAALPALIRAMGAEDPEVRRAATNLGRQSLRPGEKLLEHRFEHNELNRKFKELDEKMGLQKWTEWAKSRLSLYEKLVRQPDEVSKDEALAVKRLGKLIGDMERESLERKTPPSEREKQALRLCKLEWIEQQSALELFREQKMEAVRDAAVLMAQTGEKQTDLKVMGSLIKRALALGANGGDPKIQEAIRKVIDHSGGKPPADVMDAFKKAGGVLRRDVVPDSLDGSVTP